MVHIVLWIVQGLLALFFLAAGAPKVLAKGLDRWTGFADLPRGLVIVIGATEVLGAIGLVLPMTTGVLTGLTPLAALGLAVTVLMASGFHIRADEWLPAVETGLWASIAIGVSIGRWDLLAPAVEVPGGAVIAALAVLVPAVLANLVALWGRSGD